MGIVRVSAAVKDEFLALLRERLAEGQILLLRDENWPASPASPDTPLFGQAAYGQFTLEETDPGDPPSGGEWVLTPIADTSSEAAATPQSPPNFARIVDADGVAVLDVDVGLPNSGATLRFDTLTFPQGQSLHIESALLRFRADGGS